MNKEINTTETKESLQKEYDELMNKIKNNGFIIIDNKIYKNEMTPVITISGNIDDEDCCGFYKVIGDIEITKEDYEFLIENIKDIYEVSNDDEENIQKAKNIMKKYLTKENESFNQIYCINGDGFRDVVKECKCGNTIIKFTDEDKSNYEDWNLNFNINKKLKSEIEKIEFYYANY